VCIYDPDCQTAWKNRLFSQKTASKVSSENGYFIDFMTTIISMDWKSGI